MSPPFVKMTRTVPVSASAGDAKPDADSSNRAAPKDRIRCFLIGTLSAAGVLVWGGPGLIQFDNYPCDIGGYFETALGALQTDHDAFVVLELDTADAADYRTACADHAVGAGKIAELIDVVSAPDQLVDRRAGRQAETETLDRERVVAVAKRQGAPAAAGSHDKSCLGDRDTNRAGDRVRRDR